MNLLLTFLVTCTVAVTGMAWLAVMVDKMSSPFVSLVFFFPAMFAAIWLTWKLSIKLTEPKKAAALAPTPDK